MRATGVLLVEAVVVLSGCATETTTTRPDIVAPSPSVRPTPLEDPSPTATRPPERPDATSRDPGPEPSDGSPAAARLTVPDLDLRDFPVVPYRGRTDDARGTDIQNDGSLASPHGPRGGTGPGGLGNYQVTGHRLSSTMPFRYLPQLTRGDEVYVDSGGVRYVYRVTATRQTSFRSARSLREQRAAVPGQPGAEPARAVLTLSTCATLEDHAEGNFWSDRFDNPEHRIDKIAVLVRTVRSRP